MGRFKSTFCKMAWMLRSLVMLGTCVFASLKFEHRDAALRDDRTLLQRDTCWEAWLSIAEERGGCEMNCDAGLAHEGRDRIQQLVHWSLPPTTTTSSHPSLSAATIKAGKGTWQVDRAEVMASAQTRDLELLKKRAVSQQGLRESWQSGTGTVCLCVHVKVNTHLQVNVGETETCGLTKRSF